MPEMIGPELKLEPVLRRQPCRRPHNSGIVRQKMDRLAPAAHGRRKGLDPGQRRQIQKLEARFYERHPLMQPRQSRLTLVMIAPAQKDRGALLRQPAGDLEAQTPVDPVMSAVFPSRRSRNPWTMRVRRSVSSGLSFQCGSARFRLCAGLVAFFIRFGFLEGLIRQALLVLLEEDEPPIRQLTPEWP